MNTKTFTALITPFKNGKVDEVALEKLVEYQINNGVDGIIPCGTTGESATVSHREHDLVIRKCIEVVGNRAHIMAGTGSNSTNEAMMTTQVAKEMGADSCLVVAPYYNKPTQEGIYQHYKALNEVGVPLILYNIPGRCVIDIQDETIARIAELENIVGIKDATGDLARLAGLRKLITKDFLYLSGEDATTVGFNAMGGNGVISVTANIAPKLVSDLQKLCANGDYASALELQDKLTPLHQAMFCESNPIPVKYAASLLGLCEDEIRLPLTTASEVTKKRVEEQMKKIGLI